MNLRARRLIGSLAVLASTGCGDDGPAQPMFSSGATTLTGEDSSDGMASAADSTGDVTSGDGDATSGDGTSGDGDGTSGDGTSGDGDGTTGDGTTGDGDGTTGDGTTGDGDGTTGDGDGTTGDGDGACGTPSDLVVAGPTGPANANQNCPMTAYPLQVSGSTGTLTDVDVSFSADVATTSEFTLWLRSPSGANAILFDRHGGPFSDDFVGTVFDDAAPSPIATAAPPRTGCFSPDEGLSIFNGETANGTWTLEVQTCLYAVSVNGWDLQLSF